MKYISSAILCLLMIFTNQIIAQDVTTSGYVKMEIIDIKAEDPSIQAQVGMMKGTVTEVFFNKEKTLTTMSMMGGMMETKTLVDLTNKTGFMLFNIEMLGQKVKVNLDETLKKQNEESKNLEIDIKYFPEEKKEILGYSCYKAVIKQNVGGQDSELIMYVTEDIKTESSPIQGIDGSKFKGYPLEYSMNAQGVSIVYSATEFKKEIDPNVFEISTEGYEEKTMKEFQKSMGGMGMGF